MSYMQLNRRDRRAIGRIASKVSTEQLDDASPLSLRDYQEAAVAELRASYMAGNRAVLLVLPTGGGKTHVFAFVVRRSSRIGNRVLVVAHRRELIKQASAKLTLAGVTHGIIAPGFDSTDDAVQVGGIQTLARRLDRLSQYDFIIFDEAHHSVASQYVALIEAMPNARILGVTATPQRFDGKGLGIEDGGIFDDMVIGASVAELIDSGALCPSRVYAPASMPDLSGVRTHMGDFVASDVDEVMSARTVIGDAVEQYQKHAAGRSAIAFCATVANAERVAEAFRSAGVSAKCVHGKLPTEEREATLAALGTGEVQIVTSCDLIGEGLDVPSVGAVILLRPTKSVALHLQQIGRGMRPAPGKSDLVVLDHCGNCMRSGFAEEPRSWSLRGRAGRTTEVMPEPYRCPECGAVHRPSPECPSCGHKYPVPEGNNPRQVEEIGGELQLISAEERQRRIQQWPLRKLLSGNDSIQYLREIRKARGYRRGWIRHVLREQQQASEGAVQ